MRNKVYLSLVHYPVYNRNKDIVCTSVTNFDIHDISRSCGTYEIKGYRLVVPVDAQKKLTERIIAYWQDGTGGQYNKDREQAFRITDVAENIEEVVKEIEKIEGQKPLIITTSARTFDNSISYKDLKVPEVLLSGNHKKIDEWHLKESLRRTYLRRRELIENRELTKLEKKLLDEIKKEEV